MQDAQYSVLRRLWEVILQDLICNILLFLLMPWQASLQDGFAAEGPIDQHGGCVLAGQHGGCGLAEHVQDEDVGCRQAARGLSAGRDLGLGTAPKAQAGSQCMCGSTGAWPN